MDPHRLVLREWDSNGLRIPELSDRGIVHQETAYDNVKLLVVWINIQRKLILRAIHSDFIYGVKKK